MPRPLLLALLTCCPSPISARLLRAETAGVDAGDCTASPCLSLRYAVSQAASSDTVRLGPGVHAMAEVDRLDPGALGKADLIIEGSGRDVTTLDLQLTPGFLFSRSAGDVQLKDISITRGSCETLPVGQRYGAGALLENSTASLIRVDFRDMRCTGPVDNSGAFTQDYSGAAIALLDSEAVLQDVVVSGCAANTGGALALMGADSSTLRRCVFRHHEASVAGGAVHVFGAARTAFHSSLFSHGRSGVGGHLVDSKESLLVFTDCTFEHGHTTLHGGLLYTNSDPLFQNCHFNHGNTLGSGGAFYINGDSLPNFQNSTFLNNSATAGSGAIRSLAFGRGYLVFNNTRFISNSVPTDVNTGAIGMYSNGIFIDCLFEGNTGHRGAALVITTDSFYTTVLRRVRFVRNVGGYGGGLKTSSFNPWGRKRSGSVEMEDCIFEENTVTFDGGGVWSEGSALLSLKNVVFRRNRAGKRGGGFFIENRGIASTVDLESSVFEDNTASEGGGSLACHDPLPLSTTSMVIKSSRFTGSRSQGNGGAFYAGCRFVQASQSSFLGNSAGGSGGAIFMGLQVLCRVTNGPLFVDMVLQSNSATISGGALFFEDPRVSCGVQGVSAKSDKWDPSPTDPWHWSDFTSAVKGNAAAYGKFQASRPTKLVAKCGKLDKNCEEDCYCNDDNDRLDAQLWWGFHTDLKVNLADSFGEMVPADGLLLEFVPAHPVTQEWKLDGISRARFELGEAMFDGLKLAGMWTDERNPTVQLPLRVAFKLRLLQSQAEYSHIPAVDANITVGPGGRHCPDGYHLKLSDKLGEDGHSLCKACKEGEVDVGGKCDVCPPGRWNDLRGQAVCKKCPPGSGCPEASVNPVPCAAGYYQPEELQDRCIRCDAGKFQRLEGSRSCEPCPAPRITRAAGSLMPEDCVCPQNTYDRGDGVCQPCTLGMTCPTGSVAPQQTPGFFLLETHPDGNITSYGAYHCFPQHCPAGPAGSCQTGRSGVACAGCLAGHYACSDGQCCKCRQGDVMPSISGTIVLILLMALLVVFSQTDVSSQRLTTLTVLSTAGQMVLLLQLLSLLSGLQLRWFDPLRTIFETLTALRIDLGVLRLQCVFGARSILAVFCIKLASLPIVLAVLLLIYAFSALLTRKCPNTDDVINSLGTVTMISFLPMTLTSMEPFMCRGNPGGQSSVRNMPSVICGSEGHIALVAAGSLGTLCFTLTIFVGVAVVGRFYPFLAVRTNGPAVVRRFRFLFQRFKPTHHRYASIFVLRSLCCSLVPVIIHDSSGFQLLLLGVLTCIFGGYQCWVKPWRTWLGNVTDAIHTMAFHVILLAAAGTMEQEVAEVKEDVAFFCMLALLGVFAVMLAAASWAAVRSARRRKKYGALLTHHKAHAACMARLLKCLLTQESSAAIFLDSDDLDHLDKLFETVQCDVANVIVILTEETLRRPWCAGEIATAYMHKVPMHLIAYDGCPQLSNANLVALESLWTRPERDHLIAMGFTINTVTAAYKQLLQIDPVLFPDEFNDFGDLKQVQDAAFQLMARCGLPKAATNSVQAVLEEHGAEGHSVILVLDFNEPENLAAGEVLRLMLAKNYAWSLKIMSSEEEVMRAKGTGLVLGIVAMLSNDFFESERFMATLIAARDRWQGLPLVTVLRDPKIQFPNKMEVDNEIVPNLVSALALPADLVERTVERIMNVLAMPFSPHLARASLETEASNIGRRLQLLHRQNLVKDKDKEKLDFKGLDSATMMDFVGTVTSRSSQATSMVRRHFSSNPSTPLGAVTYIRSRMSENSTGAVTPPHPRRSRHSENSMGRVFTDCEEEPDDEEEIKICDLEQHRAARWHHVSQSAHAAVKPEGPFNKQLTSIFFCCADADGCPVEEEVMSVGSDQVEYMSC